MAVYYNEIDPFAVAWLRELIKAGHIPNGIVDDRSIVDVDASDLQGFTQHHFFAGIGGWSHALRLAGWPDDKPVWTGSCPCQPFSVAGQQKGKDDDRHLAPHWLELITQCRPPVIFGEQVAASIGKGWLDDLQDHLEAEDYACGAIVLPACSVGAPHLRQRLWFVAENLVNPEREQREWGRAGETLSKSGEKQRVERRSDVERLGVPDCAGSQPRREAGTAARHRDSVNPAGGTDKLADTRLPQPPGRDEATKRQQYNDGNPRGEPPPLSDADKLAQPDSQRSQRHRRPGEKPIPEGWDGAKRHGAANSESDSFWSGADWLLCRDDKWRPVEPGTFPLANGVSARVGRLRGYGNAIVPQVAAEVILAWLLG